MQIQLIGVSLSEPHTSVTALQVQDANLPSTYRASTHPLGFPFMHTFHGLTTFKMLLTPLV